MADYISSEELQRHKHEAFIAKQESKDEARNESERDRLFKVLDRHIAAHSSTKNVRALAREHDRTADYQLDLSANTVELLEKIKTELR